MDSLYNADFFREKRESASSSAAVVVPLAMELVKPQSVVDVGCGTGAWLAAFRSAGVERIVGIDGDYIDRHSLSIPLEAFVAADLTTELKLGQNFDLCISLEVAEHLPAVAARGFVTSLVQLAPAVLFSAAVPGQTGTGHVNERWPNYWMSLFAEHGYVRLDPFRKNLWHDCRVAWWYRQNLFLYIDPRRISWPGFDANNVLAWTTPSSDLVLLHFDIVRRLETTICEQRHRIDQLSTGRGALVVLGQRVIRKLTRWLRRPVRE